MDTKLTKNQKKTMTRDYMEDGNKYRLKVTLEYDDNCGNGHNTFSVTGDIDKYTGGRPRSYMSGCVHEEIAEHYPELKKYIKWHLVSSDGPMHYLANTLYHASDKDYRGFRKGEPDTFSYKLKFEEFPITFKYSTSFIDWIIDQSPETLEIEAHHHPREPETFTPNYSFKGFAQEWYKAPFHNITEAEEFLEACQICKPEKIRTITGYSQGKEPELESARRSAIWPDATLEQLQDKKALEDRLESLLKEFQKDMEEIGFIF